MPSTRGSKRSSSEANLTANDAKAAAVSTTGASNVGNGENDLVKLQMQLWLDEFDLEVKSRIRALRSQAEDESLVLRRELDIQIMRYPTRVRQLTVREFERDFAGNVLLASARKVDPTPSYSVLATPRGAVQSVAATPLSVRSQQKRQQLTAAVVAKRTVPAASQIVSHIASSTTAAASVDKDSAREQIRLLQEQLNGLMASLQSPAGK